MTAPAMHVKVSGAFKAVNKMHVRVSGAWKQVTNGYVNVSGTWKKFLQSITACSLGGSLSVSSGLASPTSSAVTVTVPAGNSGALSFANVSVESGTAQYKKNSGSFAAFGAVTCANGDTLTVRGLSMTAATTITFDLVDSDTGTTIGSYTIART